MNVAQYQQGGKSLKKKQEKSKQQQQEKSKLQKQEKAPAKKTSSSASKSKVSKKGGALLQDVQNLAVPFAILLAKEGLTKMFKDEKKSSPSTKSVKTASKPSGLRRRSTMTGGSCNLGCAAQTGGQAAKQLFQLQKDIDNFLEKY